MMNMYKLTIGLNDKNTEKQELETAMAKNIIAGILLNDFEIYAFTMIECEGVYKMESTGNIVFEKSIRVEIASDNKIDCIPIISSLKAALNQECIMLEKSESDIDFA